MAKKRVNPELDDHELLAIIASRKANGLSFSDGELAKRREVLLRRYMGAKYGNEVEGQSSVVTRQCMEAVEWTLPSLLRVFLSSPTIAKFDPIDGDDEELAEQETLAVNKVVGQKNGFMNLLIWIKDMLMNPGAYIKVYWKESKTVKSEEYTGLLEQEAEMLLQQDGVEPLEYDTETISLNTPVGPLTLTVYDIKIRRTEKTGRIVIEPVPPEEMSIDGKLTTVSLDDADFISQTTSVSRSDLIEMGFDIDTVYDLSPGDFYSEEANTRKEMTQGSTPPMELENSDPSSVMIEVDETYIKLDYDGDGVAEYRQVISSGTTVLSNEEHDVNPFVGTTAIPLPHSATGQSWMEMVVDIQRIYTTLTRQLLDNMYRVNNPRTVAGRGVNLNDLMNDIPKLPIRAKDVNQLRTEPLHPIIGQIMPAFEVLEGMKETRIGVSKGTMGLDADALARVTDGAYQGALEQANQRIEALARVFAESAMKPLMLKIHALLAKHKDVPYQVKQGNAWIEIDPSSWRNREDMTVTVGLGTGNKQAQVMGLRNVIEIQRADQQNPGSQRLVSEKNAYNARARLVEAVGLHNPENFFTDPSTLPPPQPPPPDPTIEVQREFNQVEREKAKLKYQADIEEIKRKYADDERKMQEKIYALQQKITKDDREYILKEQDTIRKNYEVLLDSETEQARFHSENNRQLDQTQDQYRSEAL